MDQSITNSFDYNRRSHQTHLTYPRITFNSSQGPTADYVVIAKRAVWVKVEGHHRDTPRHNAIGIS